MARSPIPALLVAVCSSMQAPSCRPTASPHQCLHVWLIPWSTPMWPQLHCLLQVLPAFPRSSLQPPLATLSTSSQLPGTQLAHIQQMCSEAPGLTGKHTAGCELAGPGFVGKAPAYPQEICLAQTFQLKPLLEKLTPYPPVNGLPAPLAYPNGHYFPPLWNNILPTPNSDSSGSQDLAMIFHGGQPTGAPLDCGAAPGAYYRAGTGGSSVASQNSLKQMVDYLSGVFQQACFRKQSLTMLTKAHGAPGT